MNVYIIYGAITILIILLLYGLTFIKTPSVDIRPKTLDTKDIGIEASPCNCEEDCWMGVDETSQCVNYMAREGRVRALYCVECKSNTWHKCFNRQISLKDTALEIMTEWECVRCSAECIRGEI